MNFKKIYMYMIMMALLSICAVAEFCPGGTTSTSSVVTTQTLTGVVNSSYSYIIFGADDSMASLDTMTPNANYTVLINESKTGLTSGSSLYTAYYGANTTLPISSIKIYNATAGTQIANGNFTYSAASGDRVTISFANSVYNGTALWVTYNYSFIKGIQDVATASGRTAICGSGCGILNAVNLSSGYGAPVGLSIRGSVVLGELNGGDWDVTYTNTTRTCGTLAASTCTNIENSTYDAFLLGSVALIVLAAVGIIGILMAGFASGGSNIDIKTMVGVLIVSSIFLVIGMFMVARISGSLCA